MRPVKPRTRRILAARHGFSLMEALIVVLLMGIVLSFAMPAFERAMLTSKADRAANMIANDLRNAFSLAARQRKPVRIVVNPAGRSYTVTDRATSTVLLARDMKVGSSAFGVTTMSTTRTTLDVFPNGLTTGAIDITIAVGTRTRLIRMTRVGQVRVS